MERSARVGGVNLRGHFSTSDSRATGPQRFFALIGHGRPNMISGVSDDRELVMRLPPGRRYVVLYDQLGASLYAIASVTFPGRPGRAGSYYASTKARKETDTASATYP